MHGGLKPSKDLWNQLRTRRHKNCIRKLASTQALTAWRRLLSNNIQTARLLARCIVEYKEEEEEEEVANA